MGLRGRRHVLPDLRASDEPDPTGVVSLLHAIPSITVSQELPPQPQHRTESIWTSSKAKCRGAPGRPRSRSMKWERQPRFHGSQER